MIEIFVLGVLTVLFGLKLLTGDNKVNVGHEVGKMTLCVYGYIVSELTLSLGGIIWDAMNGSLRVLGPVSLVPFADIASILREATPIWAFVNIGGNILMFAPLGFLLPLLWKRLSTLKSVACVGFLSSVFIEFTQLFTYRATSVDDVILNTLGAVFGFGLYKLLTAVSKRSITGLRQMSSMPRLSTR